MSLAAGTPKRIAPVVGKIIGKSELTETNSGYKVINFKVDAQEKNSLGLVMKTVKRICVFFEQAIEADSALSEGDYVCFDECTSQDRVYESAKSGEKVMTNDVISKQFCAITAEQFAEIAGKAIEATGNPASRKNRLDIDWE